MIIADVISWKFKDQDGMETKEVGGTLKITKFPGGIPSQSDQDSWTAEYIIVDAKRKKKRLIKNSAKNELRKLDKNIDTGTLKVVRWFWPSVDQTKVLPKGVKLIEIDRLMRIALKAVRQATTIAEVDAVPMPVWP